MRFVPTKTWRPRPHTLLWGTVLIGSLALPFVVLGETIAVVGDTTGGAATAPKEMAGTISRRSRGQLWVDIQAGETIVLTTDDSTTVYEASGNPQLVEQIRSGQHIKATYDLKADERRAIRIDVQRIESRWSL